MEDVELREVKVKKDRGYSFMYVTNEFNNRVKALKLELGAKSAQAAIEQKLGWDHEGRHNAE